MNQVCKSKVTLFFEGSREVMLARVLNRGTYSQRIDDNEEAFGKRWHGFNSDTMPVIEYFRMEGKVITVCSINLEIKYILANLKKINCDGPLNSGYFDIKRVVEVRCILLWSFCSAGINEL